MRKGDVLTRGRPVGYEPGACNYDTASLSEVAILSLGFRGVADLVIVVVKLRADEGMATCKRRKLAERDKGVKGEGPDMLMKSDQMHGRLLL